MRGELYLCTLWANIQSRFIADQGHSKSTIQVACEPKCAEIQCSGTKFHIHAA